MGPFIGHMDSVLSVVFSPDSRHIISGLQDGTIRVWNTTTGEIEPGPCAGHTSPVSSVAFSLDCQRIVSGSSDGTIRVWKATLGETDAGTFIGHMDSVESVAFSPDGQCIVSSRHGLICVLNATTGNTEITGHVNFTDYFMINDEGWICGSKGELFMWVPPIHRAGFYHPSNIWVASKYETRVNPSTFVHGQNWTTCINT